MCLQEPQAVHQYNPDGSALQDLLGGTLYQDLGELLGLLEPAQYSISCYFHGHLTVFWLLGDGYWTPIFVFGALFCAIACGVTFYRSKRSAGIFAGGWVAAVTAGFITDYLAIAKYRNFHEPGAPQRAGVDEWLTAYLNALPLQITVNVVFYLLLPVAVVALTTRYLTAR